MTFRDTGLHFYRVTVIVHWLGPGLFIRATVEESAKSHGNTGYGKAARVFRAAASAAARSCIGVGLKMNMTRPARCQTVN